MSNLGFILENQRYSNPSLFCLFAGPDNNNIDKSFMNLAKVEDGSNMLMSSEVTIAEKENDCASGPNAKEAFHESLAAASEVYANLRKEKEIQATSKVVKEKEEDRRNFFAKKGVITPSYWKYMHHYTDILEGANGEFFSNNPSRTFADLGSAPGGMSAFLCQKMKWTGRAFSLSPDKNGFNMVFRDKYRLKFSKCDLSVPHSWKKLVAKVETENLNVFDFVNLGITLQWQQYGTPTPEEKGDSKPLPKSAEGKQDEKHTVDVAEEVTTKPEGRFVPMADDNPTGPESVESNVTNKHESGTNAGYRNHRLVLQEIIRNELMFALKTLESNGSLMVVLPSSDHPNTFLYLSFLSRCTSEPIRILPTPSPGRNPIYVLVQKIKVESDEAKEFMRFLELTEVTPENDAKWSVSCWDDAKDVFEQCKTDLEKIWTLQLKALKKQRE